MKRYYFYKRSTNFREDLKGDLIDFSLCAFYSTKAYSQKHRKEVSQFSYFDDVKLCLSTRTQGIYQVRVSSGSDGCMGHYATSLKELKESLINDGYNLITEREYFRFRKLAFRLVFKHIKFFQSTEPVTRNFFYQNSFSRFFYDIKLVSTSEKTNIRNYPDSTIQIYKENNWRLSNCRIDEKFSIFLSKDKNNRCNTFQIESIHFNSYYETVEEFKKSSLLNFKDNWVESIKDFQFDRLKKIIIEMILERSDLNISSLLKKQTHSILILD